MKWLCVIALLLNLLLMAYAGYAFITVPQADVSRVKAELREAIDRAESSDTTRPARGTSSSPRSSAPPPRVQGVDEYTDGFDAPDETEEAEEEVPEGLEGAVGVRQRQTYDMDYEENPNSMQDQREQGLEDAREMQRINPLR